MAQLIKPNGTITDYTPGATFRERRAQLTKMLETDEFDYRSLREDGSMVVDDMGVAKRLPLNPEATRRYQQSTGSIYKIYGAAVFYPPEESL